MTGETLKLARERKRLTLSQVCVQLGARYKIWLSPVRLNHFETGRARPSPEQAKALVEILDLYEQRERVDQSQSRPTPFEKPSLK